MNAVPSAAAVRSVPFVREKAYDFGWFAVLALIQGLFYLATGLWPLIDMQSFQAVTGPKTDLWLVNTVGILVTVVGLVLLLAAWRRRVTAEVVVLAVGGIVALTGIDLVYTSRGVISRVYLLDAAAEGILLLGWLGAGWRAVRAT